MPKSNRKLIGSSGSRSWDYPNVKSLVTITWTTNNVGANDGKSGNVELALFDQPLDSCSLRADASPYDASYFFDMELRGYFATGQVSLHTDPDSGETYLRAQFKYGELPYFFNDRIRTWQSMD